MHLDLDAGISDKSFSGSILLKMKEQEDITASLYNNLSPLSDKQTWNSPGTEQMSYVSYDYTESC